MKKLFNLCLVLVLIGIVVVNASASEAFIINELDTHYKVLPDNSYEVTERIRLTFTEERRGIIRFIPMFTHDGDASITKIRVENDPHHVSTEGRYRLIRIGDADVYLIGEKEYVIKYTFHAGKDPDPEFDFFYMNVIPGDFDTIIEKSSTTIEMPYEFNHEAMRFIVGKFNETADTDDVEYTIEGNTIKARVLRALEPGEIVTVAIELPEGYYDKAKSVFERTLPFFYALWALTAFVAIWIFTRRMSCGPKRKLVYPISFYPPDGMTPADVGYVVDSSADSKDITALLVYWAAKGYLDIVEDADEDGNSGGFTLVKQKDMGEERKPYEIYMFNQLFEYGDGTLVHSDDLKQRFYTVIDTVKNRVRNQYNSTELIESNINVRIQCGILALLPLFFNSYLGYYPYRDLMGFAGAGVALVTSGMIIGYGAFAFLKPHPLKKYSWIKKLAIIGHALISYFIVIYSHYQQGNSVVTMSSIAIWATTILNLYLIQSMPRLTSEGERIYNGIGGFRTFILTADKLRLEALVSENSNYYYETLAYAMVLGLTKIWADKFKDIEMEPPDWYHAAEDIAHDSMKSFNLPDFDVALEKSLSSIRSAMVSSPPSERGSSSGSSWSGGSSGSGSFSGGSSGGGGGGGGGRSW